jgi:TRAP-type C4-dicarboxylate transport system permease small subunit
LEGRPFETAFCCLPELRSMSILETAMTAIDKAVDGLHWFSAVVCIPAMTAVITVDVVMRYVFNAPFDWSIEFNEAALLLILFGSLPYTTKVNGHIRMELIYRKGTALRLANALWAMAGLFFSILLGVRTASEIPFLIKIHKYTEFLGIPVWALRSIVLISAILMTIYFLHLLFYGVRKVEDESDLEGHLAEGKN